MGDQDEEEKKKKKKKQWILLLTSMWSPLECDVRWKKKNRDNEKRYQEAWKWNKLCNILVLDDGHLNYAYRCVRGQALRAAFFFFNTTL